MAAVASAASAAAVAASVAAEETLVTGKPET